MTRRVGRNEPCPCGSGRKHKHCCGKSQRFTLRKVLVTRGWVMLAAVFATIAIVAIVYWRGTRRGTRTPSFTPLGVATGTRPDPWAYDSVANRHYDPVHGHWHDGPPPPLAARGTAAPPGASPPSGPTPAAWTFDPATNRHWDPNHGHWHPGPPPGGTR